MLTDIDPCKIEEKSQLLQDGEVPDVMRDMKLKIKQVIISKKKKHKQLYNYFQTKWLDHIMLRGNIKNVIRMLRCNIK